VPKAFETDDACARAEQLFVFIEEDVAVVVDRGDAEPRSCLETQLLPGNDIGVMFQPGDDDLVACLDIATTPALGDQIDPFSRPAHEDDLVRRRRADEAANLVARRLVSVGRSGRERVRSAVDV
jgi:hypothetical protein